MSVVTGVTVDATGREMVVHADPEREAYYARAIERARAIADGETVSGLACEPPSPPPFGDGAQSLEAFADAAARAGVPVPASFVPLIASLVPLVKEGEAQFPVASRTEGQGRAIVAGAVTAGAEAETAAGEREAAGKDVLGTVAESSESLRREGPGFAHIPTHEKQGSVSHEAPPAKAAPARSERPRRDMTRWF